MRLCDTLALLLTAGASAHAANAASAADTAPIPQTAAEWQALRFRRDQSVVEDLEKLRERLRVTVTPRLIAGVACYEIMPRSLAAANRERLVVNSHGGSHVFKSGEAGTLEGIYLAGLAQIRVETDLQIYEGHSHGEFLIADTPDTRQLFASIARFLDAHLSR